VGGVSDLHFSPFDEVYAEQSCRPELTSVGVELCVVQVLQDVFDGLDVAIPSVLLVPPARSCGTHCLGCNIHLKVASDEELTSHVCGIWVSIDLKVVDDCIWGIWEKVGEL
jgi:hypothetical protein